MEVHVSGPVEPKENSLLRKAQEDEGPKVEEEEG